MGWEATPSHREELACRERVWFLGNDDGSGNLAQHTRGIAHTGDQEGTDARYVAQQGLGLRGEE